MLDFINKSQKTTNMDLNSVFDKIIDKADNISLSISAVFTLSILTISLLGTWNFIEMTVSQITLGLLMLAGGLMMGVETYIEGKKGIHNKSDITGGITAVFSFLYGAGLITESTLLQQHFGGVQGGVLFFLWISLLYEGLFNSR